jgi:transcriptional regulator with XRE-family HTH domain
MAQPTYNDRLRALRARLGLTQEQMAERFRVTERTIRNYETGKKVPGPVEIVIESMESQKSRKSSY